MADVSLFIESNAEQVSKSFSKLSNSIVGSVGRAKALADAMSFADTAFNKGKISGQQYSRIISQLDKEEDRLYSSLGQVNTQINKQSVSLSQNTRVVSNAAVAAKRLTDAQRLAGKSTNKFGMYSQQVGYQVGDFFVQVQSGTDALVAFGQQGTQLAGLLPGLIGAIAGIGLSLGTALLRSRMQAQGLAFDFQKMKEDVIAALEPIKPLIDVIGNALVFVRDKLASFGRFILDNLDRIITYGITAASVFGVRLVAGLVAAKVAAFNLRGALIKTGIGALVVVVGELVYQFTLLVKGAGGFGNAISLMGGVVQDVFDRIRRTAALLAEFLSSMWLPMEAGFRRAVSNMLSLWGRFLKNLSSGMIKSGLMKETGLDLAFEAGMVGQAVDSMVGDAEHLDASWKAVSSSIGESLQGVWGEPIKSLEDLRKAMAAADAAGKSIDLSSWFKGDSGDEDSSGSSVEDSLTEMQKRVQSIADTIKSSMSEAFMSMVEGTKSFKDAMKDMAKAVIKQLYDVLVVQRLVGSFNAQTGQGSGIVGAIMGAFQANGGAWQGGSQIQAYADGGVVGGPTLFPMSGGKTGLMGEAGPEAIMPLKRGANGKLGVQVEGNAGGDVNIVQNFSFAANGDDSVKKLIAQAAPQIAQMTQKQIMDSRRRGGAMKSTFG